METGAPDATNKDLIFDPESSTAANQVIKLVSGGSEGGSAAAIVTLYLDDSAYVTQTPKEA